MSPFNFSFSDKHILSLPTPPVEEHLEMGKQLGKGHFGLVRACTDKRTGELLACKSIPKSKLRCWDEREDVRREVEIMERLGSHPNIVALRAAYEDSESVHLVLDYCEGGELFDEVSLRGPLSERRAAQVLHGLAKAVAHCHALGVFHRDLKPENILLVSKSEQRRHVEVKLADFGLSLKLSEGQTVSGLAGSPYYLAPEVLSRSYGNKADIWSMGVVLYMMLSETAPFYGDTEADICESIAKAEVQFSSSVWKGVSPEAKNLIRWMLQWDPADRPTARAVLQHPWLLAHTKDVQDAVLTPAAIHRSSSSTPCRSAAVEGPVVSPSASSSALVQQCQSQSLPRGSRKASDLLSWFSPQLAAVNGVQGLNSGNVQDSPLLRKFDEALADLDEGIHYFVLDKGKETGREHELPEVGLEGVGGLFLELARVEKQQGQVQQSCKAQGNVGRARASYEPTPADALDWIFGL